MKRLPRLMVVAALVGACAPLGPGGPEAGPRPEPVPVAFRLAVTGKTGVILGEDGRGRLVVEPRGDAEPVELSFTNDALTVAALPPGRYRITGLGALLCRGLGFEVPGEAAGRDLGTIRAEVIETRHYVALMASRPTSAEERAALARDIGAEPDAIDSSPLVLPERAPCFVSKAGPGQTFHDLPLEQKALVAVGFAAFCALAVASGGFCAF